MMTQLIKKNKHKGSIKSFFISNNITFQFMHTLICLNMLQIFIIIVSIFIFPVNADIECFVQGNCVGSSPDSIEVVNEIKFCVIKCRKSNICIYSTFNSNNNQCSIFTEKICSEIKDEDCPMCITSEKDCAVSMILLISLTFQLENDVVVGQCFGII